MLRRTGNNKETQKCVLNGTVKVSWTFVCTYAGESAQKVASVTAPPHPRYLPFIRYLSVVKHNKTAGTERPSRILNCFFTRMHFMVMWLGSDTD